MTNNDRLNVWFNQKLVGHLWRDSVGNIGFKYDDDWLHHGFAISQQLPLTIKVYSPPDTTAHRFFANLLPEAGARMHVIRNLKIANSDFELLKAIGGECAGALSILPSEHDRNLELSYKELTEDEIRKIVLRKGNFAFFNSEENRPRLSLAGVQDKYPIMYDGNSYFLPEDAAPSTHIMKFEMNEYRHIPVYEYFLTLLAKTLHLPTVESQLKRQGPHYFLLIKRYDRIVTAEKKIERLHQEDFCQGLGIGYEHKYQQDGGPSFSDCYKLIQQISTDPIIDTENLLRWQIFNWLTGNSDGHAKNIAIVYKQRDVRLAPFYDLVCTRAIEGIDIKLAFSVGGEFNPSNLTASRWGKLAQECSIRPKYLFNIILEMATNLQNQLESTEKSFEQENGVYPALQRVKKIIVKQCKQAMMLLKDSNNS